MRRTWSLHLLVGLLVLAASCQRQEPHSALFKQILRPELGKTFRGVDFLLTMDEVRKIEGNVPQHDDKYGLIFMYRIDDTRKYYIEYLCKNPQVRLVNSMVANIFLKDEGETTELYQEIEADLRSRYGAPEGNLGDLKWQDDTQEILALLRILDDRKSLSLNYVPASGY